MGVKIVMESVESVNLVADVESKHKITIKIKQMKFMCIAHTQKYLNCTCYSTFAQEDFDRILKMFLKADA